MLFIAVLQGHICLNYWTLIYNTANQFVLFFPPAKILCKNNSVDLINQCINCSHAYAKHCDESNNKDDFFPQ